jgi:hypothetical protein
MFISLMKDEEPVNKLVTKSPISYNVFIPHTAPESLLSSLNGSQTLSKSKPITAIKDASSSDDDTPSGGTPSDGTPSSFSSSSPTQDAVADSGLPQKEFQIQIFPHPTYRHHDSFPTKLHLSWPDYVCTNESFVTRMLKQSLPNTMAAKGLANWDPDFNRQRMPSESTSKKQDRVLIASWIPGKLRARVERRQEAQASAEETVPEAPATDESQRVPGFPFSSWSG